MTMAGKLRDWTGKAIRHPWLRRGVLLAAYGACSSPCWALRPIWRSRTSSAAASSRYPTWSASIEARPKRASPLRAWHCSAWRTTASTRRSRRGHVLRQDPPAGSAGQGRQRRDRVPVARPGARRDAGPERPGTADGPGEPDGLGPADRQEPERVRRVRRAGHRGPPGSPSRQPDRPIVPRWT